LSEVRLEHRLRLRTMVAVQMGNREPELATRRIGIDGGERGRAAVVATCSQPAASIEASAAS
jgi:hypothetical protein